MNPLPYLKKPTSLFLVALACFALSFASAAFGVTPAPDGGYPGRNTAEGDNALFNVNTTQGTDNTAIGYQALYSTIIGYSNTATGSGALYSDTTGYNNTATGADALTSNTIGAHNTAIGYDALDSNTIGSANTATGDLALHSTTNSIYNTATGYQALYSDTSGHDNTADGVQALYSNTTGNSNIALGSSAGTNLTTGSNNIDIGNAGVAADAKTIRIGAQGTQNATFVAGIYGINVGSGGISVYANASGQLGTVTSSARFKRDIRSMDKASETILALRPVTFRYKPELDPDGASQFGLVAEEVEKVDPALVVRDPDGKPYSVRYEAVNAMVLNEFLKEHRKVEELEKQVEKLTAGLQKVSAQLEASNPAPQVVNNNQ
jgi:endosialidase-like protein